MELLIGGALLLLIWLVAPRLVLADAHTKGLAAMQTFCAIAGIVLLVVWYFVDRPDAERLKFDQAVTVAPLRDHRVLVVSELTIANVGGHPAKLDGLPYPNGLPYYVLVQRVSSLQPAPAGAPPSRPIASPAVMDDANNWPLDGLLAYRIGGQDLSGKWKRTAGGLDAEIAPSETENFYYRAVIACEPGLHISVSSRVQKPRSLWRMLARRKPLVWIKQSFVDLTALCDPKGQTTHENARDPRARRRGRHHGRLPEEG